jgi:RNA polymerase sigma factor (sigma-70 family)
LTKALQAAPGHLQARALQVQAELAVGDVAQADRLARGIQTQFPAKALGHRLVADVAMRQGQLPAGIEALRRAQQLEPSSDNLLRLVDTLPRNQQEAVRLFYLEDRSYEEVAELLGTDTKAVDNALQRVKRKVGRHLDSRELAV